MLRRKWFLYLTEFFAGMSVMAVELGASRLLAPYFSSSQIVWTIIIGAIMIAMALGNLWGGRAADRDPSPDRLYLRLLVAAVWVAAIPVAGKYVVAGISLALAMLAGENFLIWASLLSCLVLFVYPLMLLGTVSPSLARYVMSSLDESGRTVGRLNALNTIGSIIGTFTPTFLTIPAMGTAWTFILFAGILLALGVIYFWTERRMRLRAILSLILTVLLAALVTQTTFAFPAGSGATIDEDESVYNYLQVTETDEDIRLSTNVLFGVQSITRKDGKLTGLYYDYALAAPLMADVPEKEDPDILILGFGSGTYAAQCRTYFPHAGIDGVEIDGKIIDLAYDRFGLDPDDPAVTVTEFDGRAFLRDAGTYDVIMVDAYRDITIPFQMSSEEFFRQTAEHLTENGVLVVNLNMRSRQEGGINDWLCDTIAAVFPEVLCADVGGNREVFASLDGGAAARFAARAGLRPDLAAMMDTVAEKLTVYESGGRVLTDDKAPVELLGMQVIDEIISDELAYYRQQFRGRSLSEMVGLLK